MWYERMFVYFFIRMNESCVHYQLKCPLSVPVIQNARSAAVVIFFTDPSKTSHCLLVHLFSSCRIQSVCTYHLWYRRVSWTFHPTVKQFHLLCHCLQFRCVCAHTCVCKNTQTRLVLVLTVKGIFKYHWCNRY